MTMTQAAIGVEAGAINWMSRSTSLYVAARAVTTFYNTDRFFCATPYGPAVDEPSILRARLQAALSSKHKLGPASSESGPLRAYQGIFKWHNQ
jgi:hypothetical protein